jgi:hypothetical protein
MRLAPLLAQRQQEKAMTMISRFPKVGAASVVLASFLALGAVTVGAGEWEHGEGRANGLEGTWRVQVTIQDCTTGAPLLKFQSVLAFAEGGTLTGTTANPAFQPGQRSSDYGTWKAAGHDTFRALSEAYILFDSPVAPPPAPAFRRGVQRLTQAIRLLNDDQFLSNALIAFFDASGAAGPTGCAAAAGQRMK